MADAAIPTNFEDLEVADGIFRVASAWDPSENPDRVNESIQDILNLCVDEEWAGNFNQDMIDSIYSMIRSFADLTNDNKFDFAEAITKLSTTAISESKSDFSVTAKNALKIITYFLQQFMTKAEVSSTAFDVVDNQNQTSTSRTKVDGKRGTANKSKSPKSSNDWPKWRIICLENFHSIVSMDHSKIWTMGIIPESFLFSLWNIPLGLLEKRPSGLAGSGHAESAARTLCVDIVVKCVSLFGSGSSTGAYSALATSLFSMIQQNEHMCVLSAEICCRSKGLLVPEVLREISSCNALTGEAPKNIGAFIEHFARLDPELMASCLAVIKHQIDSPAHQIRSALLSAMGLVAAYIHGLCDMATATAEEQSESSDGTDRAGRRRSSAGVAGGSSRQRQQRLSRSSAGDDSDEDDERDGREDDTQDMFSARNLPQLQRVRDSILDILVERAHDKSYYTRTTVLKVWRDLLEGKAVTKHRICSLAELAVDRLHDKTASVRRSATALLIALLDYNPFGGRLDLALFERGVADTETRMLARVAELRALAAPVAARSEGEDGEDAEDQADGGDEEEAKEMREMMAKQREEDFMQSGDVRDDSELATLVAQRDFHQHAAQFLRILDGGVSQLEAMLRSRTLSDVQEALRYFSRAVTFGLSGSARCFQGGFALVWHQDAAIRNECLASFAGVYLTDGAAEGEQQPLRPAEMADNLVQLCRRCEESHLMSLERIIAALFQSQGADEQATASAAAASAAAAAASADPGDKEKDKEREKLLKLIREILGPSAAKGVVGALWVKVQALAQTQAQQQAQASTGSTHIADSSTSTNSCAGALSATAAGSSDLCATLRVIAMVAQLSPEVMTAGKIRLVVAAGLGPAAIAAQDFGAMRAACLCLQAAPAYIQAPKPQSDLVAGASTTAGEKVKAKRGGAAPAAQMAQPVASGDSTDLEVVQAALLAATPAIRDILLSAFCEDSEALTREWFPVCEEAMHTLFHVHPSPDKVFASTIAPLYQALAASTNSPAAAVAGGVASTGGRVYCAVARLARFLFVLGQGAQCSLVFTERIAAVAKKFADRRAKEAPTAAAGAPAGALGVATNKMQRLSLSTPALGAPQVCQEACEGAADAMEEEMGLAASADAEHEMAYAHVVEHQLVLENLLGKFHPLVAFVVADERGGFSHPLLREVSIFALCRFMAPSYQLCERYLPLLVTALEREQRAELRTSALIALGDLAFRFPNALEPWTSYMYSRLSDDNVSVRYNTLTVLAHLILNDMVKVKGMVSHVVLCLTDPCERIRDLASQFFTKLSERANNPVYNLLGDIIAHLSHERAAPPGDSGDAVDPVAPRLASTSQGDDPTAHFVPVQAAQLTSAAPAGTRDLSTEEFQKTMEFMLSFVKKDKQADALLERLLLRLGAAQTIRQRRNLSFCISQLTITDKGVRRMVELIKLIKEALYDPEVRGNIEKAASRAKRAHRAPGAAAAAAAAAAESEASAPSAGSAGGPSAGTSTGSAADMKSAVEEFEQLLKAIRHDSEGLAADDPAAGEKEGDDAEHEQGDGGMDIDSGPTQSQQQAQMSTRGTAKSQPTPRKGRSGAAGPAASATQKGKPTAAAKVKKPAGGRGKKAAAWSDDNDDDDNEDDISEGDEENVSVNTSSTRRQAASTKRQPPPVVSAASRAGARSRGGKASSSDSAAQQKRGRAPLQVTSEMDDEDDFSS